jgi:hypothetical protein
MFYHETGDNTDIKQYNREKSINLPIKEIYPHLTEIRIIFNYNVQYLVR